VVQVGFGVAKPGFGLAEVEFGAAKDVLGGVKAVRGGTQERGFWLTTKLANVIPPSTPLIER
jgi:hypothetical protein